VRSEDAWKLYFLVKRRCVLVNEEVRYKLFSVYKVFVDNPQSVPSGKQFRCCPSLYEYDKAWRQTANGSWFHVNVNLRDVITGSGTS
jgi:hypothetical protein